MLAVEPGRIICEDGAGPQESVVGLAAAAIPFVTGPDGYADEGIAANIMAVGAALDVDAAAATLASDVARKLETAEATAATLAGDTPTRVLFILSTQGGRIMASGQNTAANGIIEMAGGVNAITEFEGYKPLSDEAVTAAAPDVILMMDRSGDHSSDDAELFAMPSIATTPAAQTQSVVRMNGLYLLGFGPRTAEAVIDLTTALYEG